jgi:hypothetical protein
MVKDLSFEEHPRTKINALETIQLYVNKKMVPAEQTAEVFALLNA